MLGNVFEWCEDHMLGGYSGAPTDGSAWLQEGATQRVARGGARNHSARFIRAAYRASYLPDVRLDYLGFRCALAAD
jgi:formylglycine-generating enzyme required for sulfatase activity